MHFPLFYFGIFRYQFIPDDTGELLELFVIANGLNTVSREDDRLRTRNVDALYAAQNTAYMNAEAVSDR